MLHAGFPAIGVDHDAGKIEQLRRGANYLPHLGDHLADVVGKQATLSHDDAALADADVILICVPTPLKDDRTPDLSYVERAACAIRAHRMDVAPDRACLVSLESTTWPGTCREVIAPTMGLPEQSSVYVAFSPEREDPGNRTYTTASIPKLVGGLDAHATRIAVGFYGAVVDHVIPCESAEIAEGQNKLN